MKKNPVQILFALIVVSVSLSQPAYTQTPISKSSKLSEEVTTLRQQGQTGLEIFLKSHAKELNSSNVPIRQALDSLCQQSLRGIVFDSKSRSLVGTSPY